MLISDELNRSNPPRNDVFISDAQKDKTVADAICAKLESRNIKCWIAPRDVPPGSDFPDSIVKAIEQCRIVVLIFSSHANNSPHVIRELTNAVNKGRNIVPFRIEDIQPSRSMEYLIGVRQWLDAVTPPLENHFDELAGTIENILAQSRETSVCSACKTPFSPNAKFCDACGAPVSSTPALESSPVVPSPVVQKTVQPVSIPEPVPPTEPSPRSIFSQKRRVLVGTGVLIVVLIALYLIIPMIASPSQSPTHSQNERGGGLLFPNSSDTTTVDYRSQNTRINTATLTTDPTQILPKGNEFYLEVEKNSITAEINVKFGGGPGQGFVKDNQVILTRSDGTVTQGKLNFDQQLSEITLQGTRGTDRLQVIVILESGATYTIMDKLIPYRSRA